MMVEALKRGLLLGSALAALAMLSGCGGDSGGSVVNSTPPPPVPPPAPPPPPPPPPPTSAFKTPEFDQSNAAIQSGAITAYETGATGVGVIAAVVDSGVSTTTGEFTGRIHPASADLAGNRGIGDDGGHGTLVSGVLLAAKNDSGSHGVAFRATLLVARTDTPGSCANTAPDEGCSHNDNAIALGVDLATNNKARVINISLGGSPANANLRAAIGRATAAGIIIVISGGNDGTADPDPLAQIANEAIANNLVIIAGGLTRNTNPSLATIASFSDRAGNGASHYLAALGSRVNASDQNGVASLASGTSFSAPTISGAVALLAQAFPNLTGAQIVDLLYRSAYDLGDAGVDAIYGRGGLNIARAFAPQGGASLAGSAVPVTFGATGTLSTAMGDGGQTGASVVILDGYGRAYNLGLDGGFRTALSSTNLSNGLSSDARSYGVAGGKTALSFSKLPGGVHSDVERLLQSGMPQQQARALAGSVVTRLGPKTSLALGISSSGIALARDLEGGRSPAFLSGYAVDAGWGFASRARTGFAIVQQVGGFAISLAAENGVAQLREDDVEARLSGRNTENGYGVVRLGLSRTLGPVRLGLSGTWLDERATVLGGRLGSLYAGGGAGSGFADGRIDWQAGRRFNVGAAWRQGWTRVAGGALHPGADWLQSNAWSVNASRAGLLAPDDSLSIRLAQPLRISKGNLTLRLPTSYDYATLATGYGSGVLNLAPTGRELDAEAVYGRPLAGGFVTGNLYYRRDPGNIAALPADLGVALRFTLGL